MRGIPRGPASEPVRGTARLTAGTGAYRGITSGDLQARDHNTLDGQLGTFTVNGTARF